MAAQAMEGEDGLSAAFKKELSGIPVCLVCGPGDRFPSGKCHKSRTRHEMRPMTADERQQEIAMYRAIEADGEEARLRILDQRRLQSRQAFSQAAGAARRQAAIPEEYVLDFGKYSGKPLSRVWREHREYFGYLVSQPGFLDAKFLLRRAMEEQGILSQAQELSQTMRSARSAAHLARAQTEDLSVLHPEVAQLHRL